MLIEIIENKDERPFLKLIGRSVVDKDITEKHFVTDIRPCIHAKSPCGHCESNGIVLIAREVDFGLCPGKWFVHET